MKHSRRSAVGLIAGLVLLDGAAAQAQTDWPRRPLRLLVGFAPGSASDLIARTVGAQLGKQIGQSVVVENRPGRGGNVAFESVVQAPPDGYTLLLATGAVTTNAAIDPGMKYDIRKDLAPIALLVQSTTVLLVNKDVPANSMPELIAYLKSKPGELNYGSSGIGGGSHLYMELLALETGVKVTHVPYKGNSQASTALQAGEIQLLFDTILLAVPAIATGRVRALGVTGQQRNRLLPTVPTFTEGGLPGIEGSTFVGSVMAPKDTPEPILDLLNTELNKALKEPAVTRPLVEEGGLRVLGGTRAAFSAELNANIEKWSRVVKAAGITLR